VFDPGKTVGEPGYFAKERDRIVRLTATVPTEVVCLHRRHLDAVFANFPVLKDLVLERLASNARLQANMFAALATRPLADRLVLRLLELVESNRGTGRGPERRGEAVVGVDRVRHPVGVQPLGHAGLQGRGRDGQVAEPPPQRVDRM